MARASSKGRRPHKLQPEDQQQGRPAKAPSGKRGSGNSAIRLIGPLLQWFRFAGRDLPWRRTRDPYAIWISEIMLQQTQAATVVSYWAEWMQRFPDLRSLARAPLDQVLKAWEGLGYYNRARNLQRAAQLVLASPRGTFPDNFCQLLELPGIGRYTAGAICSIAFDQPTPVLDGNVARVLTRVFAVKSSLTRQSTLNRLWKRAGELAQMAAEQGPGCCGEFNQAMMELGALICKPRHPECQTCPIAAHCAGHARGLIPKLPNLKKPVASTHRHFVALVLRKNGSVLLRRRPEGVVNAALWEFPNVELPPGEPMEKAISLLCGFTPARPQFLGEIKHSITRYRCAIRVMELNFESGENGKNIKKGALLEGHWFNKRQLSKLALPSAHRRIAQWLEEPSLRPPANSRRSPAQPANKSSATSGRPPRC